MTAKPTLPYKLLPELAELTSSRELAGVLPRETLARGSQLFRLASGIAYDLTLSNTGGGVLLTGSARATGVTECARCLDEASFDVEGAVEGYFILNPDRNEDALADDEFTAVGPDGVVDLAVPIIAAIIFELPQVLLCREDCAGLCPHCGVNLNEQRCGCAEAPAPDSPFAILEQLRVIDPEA
jgi:uncharacterized protein